MITRRLFWTGLTTIPAMAIATGESLARCSRDQGTVCRKYDGRTPAGDKVVLQRENDVLTGRDSTVVIYAESLGTLRFSSFDFKIELDSDTKVRWDIVGFAYGEAAGFAFGSPASTMDYQGYTASGIPVGSPFSIGFELKGKDGNKNAGVWVQNKIVPIPFNSLSYLKRVERHYDLYFDDGCTC